MEINGVASSTLTNARVAAQGSLLGCYYYYLLHFKRLIVTSIVTNNGALSYVDDTVINSFLDALTINTVFIQFLGVVF